MAGITTTPAKATVTCADPDQAAVAVHTQAVVRIPPRNIAGSSVKVRGVLICPTVKTCEYEVYGTSTVRDASQVRVNIHITCTDSSVD
jgi:hypothetical protein